MKIFSFFDFYYNVIRNSPKKYNIAMEHSSCFITMITPLFLFIAYMIVSIIFLPISILPLVYLWIPIIVGNVIFVTFVSKQGYAIQRAEERKREELKMAEWERQRKEKMRRMREEEEARQEAERVKMWEEFCRRHFEQQQQGQGQQYHQQRRPQSHSNNRANAMKLLGLNEGFTKKDVSKAYRRLSKIHHPDMGGTHNNFVKLTKAYDYLMSI